jgi:uncharacterized caspase-like protein
MPFFYCVVALLALLAPLFAAPAGAQAPERRFALVIGNSEYKAGRHPTAANDAGLIAETLRTAGFDVAGARDLDQETLRRSVREFLDKVSAAGPQAVSFVYLAGYGVQFEGENYIVPIDATLSRAEDIPIEAMRISDITRPLSGTAGGVKFVVVDAARQHPYAPAGTPLASGLALIEPDPGMLIAFNTAPGSVAPVENGPYGAFAQALAEMIGTGGIGIDDVFARVRLRVNEKTGGVAVPWYASKITQPFVFMERTPDAPSPPQQVASTMQLQSQPIQQFPDDQQAYIAALERDTIAGYEEFIAAFPDSPHVRRIRALIAVRREAILWRRVLSLNTREAYWSYLERYPQGAHVADCERRLARLAAAYDPPPAFVPMAFDDIPPPPPDEVVYLTQPQVVFEDPVFVPPPPVPDFFCPPQPPEFVDLPPPPPPIGAFFLPAPVVPFFDAPQPWVRPPVFVVAPPRPPIQRITINNTTIINNNTTIIDRRPGDGRGGRMGLTSALPGAVVTRVNSGALHVPPPAPPVRIPPPPAAAPHPGVGVLGTQVQLPPRVHAATAPGGAPQQGPASPVGPRVPVLPGAPQRQPVPPNTAATTPGAPSPGPVSPGIGRPGGPGSPPQVVNRPPPAAPTGPGVAPVAPPPRVGRPEPPPRVTRPEPPPGRIARPEPPPPPRVSRPEPPPPPRISRPEPPPRVARPAPPPPQIARPAPPPPQIARPAPPPPRISRPEPPPPRIARPAPPPPQIARPAPPPPQMVRPAPPPPRPAPPPVARPAPPPQIARPAPPPPRPAPPPPRCVVQNGKQVCR